MEYAIQIEDLVKKYNGFTALNGVSLNIEKGDVVGYLGPNGAGKTTTIKILTKLIEPTSGQVYIGGINIKEGPKEVLHNVGALIEVPGTYDYLTPNEMLTYFGKVYRMNNDAINKRIKETMELVKLSDWEHKKIGSFSTGMHRRLAIAKAIFHSPEILILDEPVIGLDPKGIRDVRGLIKQFNNDGMTVFLSSHLLGEVAEVCNRVIFLEKGRVAVSDSVKNIGNSMAHKSIDVKFLNPLTKEQINKMESIELIEGVRVEDGMVRIGFDGDPDTSYQILRELISLDYQIISYSPEKIGLEDFYVSIMSDERGVS